MSWWGSGFIPIIIYAALASEDNIMSHNFLLLDGTDLLLQDNSNFLLLGS